jgi:hypothetical protein
VLPSLPVTALRFTVTFPKSKSYRFQGTGFRENGKFLITGKTGTRQLPTGTRQPALLRATSLKLWRKRLKLREGAVTSLYLHAFSTSNHAINYY